MIPTPTVNRRISCIVNFVVADSGVSAASPDAYTAGVKQADVVDVVIGNDHTVAIELDAAGADMVEVTLFNMEITL